jgi:hypothetical protein
MRRFAAPDRWSCARTEIEGFFNLVYAHFLAAFDADADDGKARLSALLQTISASSADPSIKYRMCVVLLPPSHLSLARS